MNIYKLLRHVNSGKRDDFAGFSLIQNRSYPETVNAVNGAVNENFAAFFPWSYAGSVSTLSVYRINWPFRTLEHIQDLSFQTIGYCTPPVSLSGNILAVGHQMDKKVYLFEFDESAGEFIATATLENSNDDRFGSGAMLYGNELAVGCFSGDSSIPGAFRIFERIDASTWNQIYAKTEATHLNYGYKINFHNGIALCSVDVYGQTSDVFMKQNGTWTFIERSEFPAGIGGGNNTTLVRPCRSIEDSPLIGRKYIILQIQLRENDAWNTVQEIPLLKLDGAAAGLFPLVRFGDDGSLTYGSRYGYAYFTWENGQYQLVQEASYAEIDVENIGGESLLGYCAPADGAHAAIFMGQYTSPARAYLFIK